MQKTVAFLLTGPLPLPGSFMAALHGRQASSLASVWFRNMPPTIYLKHTRRIWSSVDSFFCSIQADEFGRNRSSTTRSCTPHWQLTRRPAITLPVETAYFPPLQHFQKWRRDRFYRKQHRRIQLRRFTSSHRLWDLHRT